MSCVTHPIVVIGIPVYNEDDYILDTLESVANQSWSDFKVLISDNASIDQTSMICQKFCEADHRFTYIRHSINTGASLNFQYLLENTDSKYFMWLGAHDLLHPEFLYQHISAMEEDNSIAMSCSFVEYIDEKSKYIQTIKLDSLTYISGMPIKRYLQAVTSIPNSDYICVNSLIRRTSLLGLQVNKVLCGDHIVVSRISYFGRINRINKCLYIMRVLQEPRVKTGQNWMERVSPDNPGLCADKNLFQQKYLEDFDKIRGSYPFHRLLRYILCLCIQIRLLKLSYSCQPKKRIEPFYLFVIVGIIKGTYNNCIAWMSKYYIRIKRRLQKIKSFFQGLM